MVLVPKTWSPWSGATSTLVPMYASLSSTENKSGTFWSPLEGFSLLSKLWPRAYFFLLLYNLGTWHTPFYPNCFWLKTNPFVCCKGYPWVSDYSGGRNFIEALKFKHLQLSLVEAFHNLGASHNHQSAHKSIHKMPITSNWLIKRFPMSSNIWISSISALNFNYHKLELGLGILKMTN